MQRQLNPAAGIKLPIFIHTADPAEPALMEAVGYPDMFGPEEEKAVGAAEKNGVRQVASQRPATTDGAKLGNGGGLTPAEWAQVRAFIQGLVAGREKEKNRAPLATV